MRPASGSTSGQRSPATSPRPPSHAGGGEQQPGGVEPVPAGVVEEDPELLGTPDVHLGSHALGQVGRGGDVAGDVAPAHGVAKCGMQLAVDVADCLGGQAAAAPMAVVEQEAVEGGELRRGKPLER